MNAIRSLTSLLLTLTPSLALAGTEAPVSTPDAAVSLCGDRLLGDVWSLRRPDETGIDFRLEATNFFHGQLSGDKGLIPADDMEFTGKLDLFVNIDGQKAGLWPGLFINLHGEYRYGDAPNQGGAISPTNTAIISPRADGDVFALTNVTITQALSESFLVTIGKFNAIDLADKKFYGGRGTESFMNTSLVAMPIAGRTFPVSTLGAVATVLKDGAPFINFGVLDSLSPSTSPGWDGLNSDEMTFFADITLTADLGGRPGYHTISGAYSTIEASSLDQSGIIDPPNPGGITANIVSDSWFVSYLWEQYLTQNANDPTRGWGTFLYLALSDGDPNPLEYSIAAGLVGNGVCAARPCDTFGVGLFYNGVSGDLKHTLGNTTPPIPRLAIQDEYGCEIFYDLAITDWFHLSADLQVVQPVLDDNDTAIVGGLRSRIVF